MRSALGSATSRSFREQAARLRGDAAYRLERQDPLSDLTAQMEQLVLRMHAAEAELRRARDAVSEATPSERTLRALIASLEGLLGNIRA